MVYGDLKPDNIVLSDSGEALLIDFGLSIIEREEIMATYTPSHRIGGSAAWMSPECIRGESRSSHSDSYSFGNLAFTVLTGEMPYAGLTETQIILKVCGTSDANGPVGDWGSYSQLQGPIKDLLVSCWSLSPSRRPPMSDVVQRLDALLVLHDNTLGSE